MTAEHVPFTGGVPPVPPGANVIQHSRESAPAAPRPPVVPIASHDQVPGYVAPKPAAQDGVDPAELEAFRAWQASQKEAPAEAPPEETPEPIENEPITDPAALLELADAAAKHDPVLASQVNLLRAAVPEMDIQRAVGNALIYGDPNLVDLAYIKEVAGAKAEDATALAKAFVESCVVAAERAVANVIDTAGGKANWQAATAAFNKLAPAHMKTVVKTLMNSGDPESIKHATSTVVEFAKQSGAMPQPGALVKSGAAAPATSSALSKEEFQAELRKLNPTSRNFNEARNELFQRRQLGKKLGK